MRIVFGRMQRRVRRSAVEHIAAHQDGGVGLRVHVIAARVNVHHANAAQQWIILRRRVNHRARGFLVILSEMTHPGFSQDLATKSARPDFAVVRVLHVSRGGIFP